MRGKGAERVRSGEYAWLLLLLASDGFLDFGHLSGEWLNEETGT